MVKINDYPDWRDLDKFRFKEAIWMMENNVTISPIKPRRGGRVYLMNGKILSKLPNFLKP